MTTGQIPADTAHAAYYDHESNDSLLIPLFQEGEDDCVGGTNSNDQDSGPSSIYADLAEVDMNAFLIECRTEPEVPSNSPLAEFNDNESNPEPLIDSDRGVSLCFCR